MSLRTTTTTDATTTDAPELPTRAKHRQSASRANPFITLYNRARYLIAGYAFLSLSVRMQLGAAPDLFLNK